MAACLAYTSLYLAPVGLVLWICRRILSASRLVSLLQRLHVPASLALYSAAVITTTLLQAMIFVDGFVFKIFDFHLNGFVWNLAWTRGGIESTGIDSTALCWFAGIFGSILLVQAGALVLVLRVRRLRQVWDRPFSRRRLFLFVSALVALFLLQGAVYGVSALVGHTPVLAAADAFPLFQPVTFNRAARTLGVSPKKQKVFKVEVGSPGLHYPLNPIQRFPSHKTYNLVWLVAESFRADMVDPEIMPQTWAFAQRSLWFRNHYSGGNGTRMGLFAMFYGLYGNSWFKFLHEKRGPVLMDLLVEDRYQMAMFTSANFSYPEFDKTIFAQVPREDLHERTKAKSRWERDRENATKLLGFVKERDHARPFMTFMFFESPHARYYFPPENAIRTPYLEDLNYATMDIKRDIGLMKNRYLNACNHLDGQIGRILAYLEEQGLLDSTVVVITSDHGEEFLEKGHWGHNSSFSQEQIQSPLILWIPGEPPRQIGRITSHLDIPATILPLLGVTNPASDYSHGLDLLGPASREFTIISDWGQLAYVDHEFKATFPVGVSRVGRQKVTTRDDGPVSDTAVFYQSRKWQLGEIFKDLGRFGR